MTLKMPEHTAGRDVPENNPAIVCAGQRGPAVGTEGDLDVSAVVTTREAAEDLPGCHVSQDQRPIVTTRERSAPVRAERYPPYDTRMAREVANGSGCISGLAERHLGRN